MSSLLAERGVGDVVVGAKVVVVVVVIFTGRTVVVLIVEETTSEEAPQADSNKRRQKPFPRFFIPISFPDQKRSPSVRDTLLLFLRHSEKSFIKFDYEEMISSVRFP